MARFFAALPLLAVLAACNMNPTGADPAATPGAKTDSPSASTPAIAGTDAMAATDPAPGASPGLAAADDKPRPTMQLQVVLDRLGFTPGVVDGREGSSTRNAIAGFQEANGLKVSGTLDDATKAKLAAWQAIPATRLVTIPADFAAGLFLATPARAADQAKLPRLGYASLDEKLAERFHTTIAVLRELNRAPLPDGRASGQAVNEVVPAFTETAPPPASAAGVPKPAPATYFRAGQQIRVPNVGADRIEPGSVDDAAWATTLATLGVGTAQPKVARVVVSKSKGTLKGYDEGGKLVAMYTATMGSRRDPLPLGEWKILGIARNPPFHYNPELFWDVPDSTEKQLLPPGPNGPVGVVWIDLSKEHYGIHGTPEPETIGRAQSHGCVRLTNWDVARLSQMVSTRTQVLFEA